MDDCDHELDQLESFRLGDILAMLLDILMKNEELIDQLR